MSETLWGSESHLNDLGKPVTPRRLFRFFVGILIFLVLAGGGALAYYLFSKPARPNVGVEVSHVDQVLLGEPFTVTVSYSNYSDAVLKNAALSLALPDGVSFVGVSSDQRVSEIAVGDVGPGSLSQQTFELVALKDPETLKRLEAKLKYQIADGSRTQFESTTNIDVPVSEPAISLSLVTPQSVVSGEEVQVTLNYQNISKTDFRNVTLSFDHPPFLSVTRTSRNDGKMNDWIIPDLPPKASGTITLFGDILGIDQTEFTLHAKLSMELKGEPYDVNTQTAQVSIAPSPFGITIETNGSSSYVAHIGDRLEYVIRYRNNAKVALQNISVQAKLSGELLVPSGLSTNGIFNSIANTITWNSLNIPELVSLAPDEERTLMFSVPLAAQFPIRRLSDKNYSLRVQVQIESPTVPPGIAAPKTISITNAETKVQGVMNLQAVGLFYDALSGILNSGPYPPRVNKSTQYTIHWRVTNYATDVSNAHVSAVLGPGVKFTGTVQSNGDTKPVYNAGTGEVTWDIPFIVATKGVVGLPLEAIFQIEKTPSVNQVGQTLPLIGESRITGGDMFTSSTLQAVSRSIDSSLPDDTKVSSNQSRGVQP